MIYLFNNNEEMIRIIPNSAIKRMYQTQTLTDENYISDRLDVEIQALNDEELSELEYMAVDDIENPQRFHYYFIVKETTEHQITSLTGVQSGIEELRKTPVYDMRPTNLSPKLIADRLLEGTNWQTGYTTDDVGTISTNFYYTDVFSALKKMCMAFGIEMQFFVEITTNRIGARYIEFRKRTGKSVGKRVVYGHNALKIVKEVEKTNTVTALIGRGKGVQVSESDEGNIGYGRKIGFESVEWKKSSGAPVDKPLGQEFVEITELTMQYGIKNSNGTVRPKIGFVEFQDEESETRLIDRTYNALLELSRPQVLLETSSVYLPDTGIGDIINVVRHDRDLRYQTRVFEITWDRLVNQAVDMKLGDRLGESENKRISRISNQVSGNISTELAPSIDELVDRLTTANGKNTNWYTNYDPMENPETMGLVRVNDNWWQPDPEFEGEFILKQWNGEMWVEILRTTGNTELVRRLEEVGAEAEEAKQAAQKAYEDAVADAKAAADAQDKLIKDQISAEIEAIDGEFTLAKQEATDKANQALADAKAHADAQDELIKNQISTEVGAIGDELEINRQDAADAINQALADAKAHAIAQDTLIKNQISTQIGVVSSELEDAKQDAITAANQALADAKAHADAQDTIVKAGIQAELDEANVAIADAKQQAQDAYNNAVAEAEDLIAAKNQEYEDAFVAIGQEVDDAQSTADTAVNQINTAVQNAGFTSLDNTLKNLNNIANSAQVQINTAVQNAGFTSLDDTLKNLSTIASGAQNQIDTAIQNAGFATLSETLESTRFLGETAHADAQTAIDNAQAAQSKALEALGKAEDANQGVSDLDLRVDDVEGELELKANNAYIDSEGSLTTLSNAITINAERFSSDMQRIESKVEVLSGEVNLVMLRNAFVGKRLLGGEVYPNATVTETTNDTMAEMITVVPEERIALSKQSITGDNFWRINLYNASGAYVTRYASDLNQVVYTIPAGIVKMWVSYPRDSRPQIVRGELFVPYRPNMADQMTTEEVVIFRNEYDEFAEGTSRRLTAIDSSGGRLDIAETNIQTTAQGLQTAVGRIDGTDTALSTLEQTASGLQSQVFNADGTSRITQLANGLQTAVGGGRNLLSGTRDFSPNPIGLYNVNNFDIVDEAALDFIGKRLTLYIQSPTSGTSLNRGIYLPKELFKADREYIFSFYGRNWDGYAPINALASSGTITHLSSTDEGNLFKRHVFKITNNTGEIYIRPNGNGIYESTFVAHVVMPQLEYGSQVTPYSQSPKDAVSQSQVTQLSDSITSSISGVDGRVATIRQDLNTITQTVGDNDTKLSDVEQTADGLKSAVYNADGTSKITQLATGISSVVTNLSELDISGRNLVVTHNEIKDYFVSSTGSLEYLVGVSTMRAYIKVEPEEVLTFTKQAKGDNTWRVGLLDGSVVYESRFVNVSNSFQYTVPAGIGYLRVSYPTGSSPKIERGNKATRYSPAPEDMATQSQVIQLSDSITSSISGVDDRVSTIRQDLDSISSTVSDNDTKISDVEQTADGLKSAVYNADGTSKITQLATGITSVVNNLSELDISGRNLVVTGDEVKDYFIGSTGSLQFLAGSSTMRDYIKVTHGEVLTFTKQTKGDNYWRVAQLDGAVAYKSRFVNTSNSFQYTVPTGIGYLRVSYPTGSSPKIERGSKATPYSPAPEDIATQSQITQLADSVNLRVSKDELISQINIEAGRTLIQSDKLILDASTVTFTGSAFIPSAIINNLEVNKLTGTVADFTTLRSKIITADSIAADRLVAGTALVDKVFASQASVDHLWSKSIWANKITAMELNAGQIKAGTIATARLNATEIITSGLIANVIKAEHILADALLVDKVFSNTASVNKLWAMEMWSNKITTMELEAGQIKSGTIATARLNATEIVAGGLVANVIKSEHILADALLVDKVFSNQASVNKLWAMEMWSNKITAMELKAGQIKSGTIETARLDATDIVTSGLTADVIESTYIKADELLVEKVFANQASVDRLWAKEIWSNKITAIELKASQIKSGTIETARLDAKEIVTDGLVANVIKSEHILADALLVDKVFSNQASINKLWAMEMWSNKITAMEIDASQINTGTLNAANVTITNLDVNNLTGNKTNFVQTAWNGISTAVKVNSEGINLLYANGVVSTRLNAGGLLFYEGGVQVALLQGMAESGNPYGYALAARTNYRVSLAYQATSTSYKSAISVRSTGAIQIGHDSASPSDVTWLTTNRILLNGSSTHAVKYTTISVFGEVCVFICNAAGNAGVAFGASELYLIRNNQATQFSSMLG